VIEMSEIESGWVDCVECGAPADPAVSGLCDTCIEEADSE
jgi:NMD protein affecting ribosome stability and mRNA decay